MFIPKCLFCDHTNPADAKYCNECGSPLHLQLCKQCEAINDAAAKICHKCGTAIATLVITPDAAALTPLAESIAAVTSGYAGLERERPSLSRTFAESQVVRVRRPASHATATPTPMSRPLLLHLDRMTRTGVRRPARPLMQRVRSHPSCQALPHSGVESSAWQWPRCSQPYCLARWPFLLTTPTAIRCRSVNRYQRPRRCRSPSKSRRASRRASRRSSRPNRSPRAHPKAPPDAKSPKPVKSVRDRRRTRTEHVAVPSAQEPTTPAAQAPEPDPVPSPVERAPNPPDPPPSLDQQLARCAYGSVFERVLCDQRVRIAYCEGRWGRVPECPSGRVADYGQ